MTNTGRTSRKRAKERARDIGKLARLCRCGRGLVTAGRVCALCAAGDTGPRFTDPAAITTAPPAAEPQLHDEPPEPPPPPAFTTSPLSAPGDPLRCSHCGHRFGRRARCHVIDGAAGAALCAICAGSFEVHDELFLACGQRHTAAAHCVATTRAAALRLQTPGLSAAVSHESQEPHPN